ncbi:MAG TPA: PEGA domain-containing protein [Polyangiaceae bacterium]|jgi:copper chaperone CopZ|nr:PEGA domain-containing protein [Polyangiaceae bacterium]
MRARALVLIGCVLAALAASSRSARATASDGSAPRNANPSAAVAPPASPNPASKPPALAPDQTAEARRHFKLGIRLYQDANYPGALAEFEAAYAAKPGAGSLQNVALCQKALFRYREAAATLEQLLEKHGTELNEGEQKAVRAAISELSGLVGSIVVNVEPSDAKVTIDGHAVAASELRAGVDVNVGEHEIVADEPGYARLTRVVSVASGQKKLPVEMKLKATDGFLNIVADDPLAAIAVDGETRAFHDWHGSVKPDADHLVQVFRDGYESYEATVTVALGQTLDVHALLGARIAGTPTQSTKPGALPPPPPTRASKGYYGLLTLGVLGLGQHPLELTSTSSNGTMGTIGLRGGYRLFSPVAVEAMLDFGKLSVDDATSSGSDVKRKYTIATVRFGPNLRLMTTGKTLRFSSTLGAGVVHHKLVLDAVPMDPVHTGGSASGFDPYFSIELGIQWSIDKFLLGAEVITMIDGASGFNKQKLDNDSAEAFESRATLALFGLGIHGGYAFW